MARRVLDEEDEQTQRDLPPRPTPYLDDITNAALRLGYDVDIVRYQILAYAERHHFCHTGIQNMIHHGAFQSLAERILQDQKSLELIFRGRPQSQIEMRAVIKIVEREWFSGIWMDESGIYEPLRFLLSDKGVEAWEQSKPLIY